MLKSYKYQKHKIEELHPLIVEAFTIICTAKKNDVFNEKKFPQALQELMTEEKTNENDLLFKPLKEIFNAVKKDEALKALLLEGLKNNNRIEELCNDVSVEPLLYRELPENITGLLKPFFNNLYEKLLNREYFKRKYAGLKDHFNQLMSSSEMTICPFCGVTDMNSQYDEGRDAYDHYLPKGSFPFSSVNFANLVPMCNECNSKNKLEKTVIYEDLKGKDKTKRKKAFYPYTLAAGNIGVAFGSSDGKPLPSLNKIEPRQLTLALKSSDQEKTESWNRVFRIDKRYKAKGCSFFKSWIDTLLQNFDKVNKGRAKRNEAPLSWEFFFDEAIDIQGEELLKDKNLIRVGLFLYLKEDCAFVDFLENYWTEYIKNKPGI